MADIPAEAVEAAQRALEDSPTLVLTHHRVIEIALAAAAPYIRAQVLAEVQEALNFEAFLAWCATTYHFDYRPDGRSVAMLADYLRDTLAGDPATTRSEG